MRLGTWITAPHPTIVELVAKQNFDWVCVDLEHSPVSRLELQSAVALIQGQGKKAFVRVNKNEHSEIKYPLDSGVDGIIVPMVNSAKEARQAVENCFYPPVGCRGVGLSRAQGFGFDFPAHLEKNLKSLELIVQVEHINAVREIDEILAIDRIAGIFLGPYDLSGSMGIPGQFEDPRMVEAIARVAEATKKSGKLLGMHVIPPSHSDILRYHRLGYNFVAFSLDTLFLGQKIKDEVKLVRDALGQTK